MKLVIKRSVATSLTKETKKALGKLLPDYWSYKKTHEIDLVGRKPKDVTRIEKAFKESKNVKGVNLILRDIERWRAAQSGAGDVKPRSLQQFEGLLVNYLKDVPNHRVYENIGGDGADDADVWLCYYMTDIAYKPARRDSPAYVKITLAYWQFGECSTDTRYWHWQDEAKGQTVAAAFGEKGLTPETDDLRADYNAQRERFESLAESVGKQMLASGTAEARGGRYSWMTDHINMTREGQPSKCVIDVFEEEDDDGAPSNFRRGRRRSSEDVTSNFWDTIIKGKRDGDDEDLEIDEEDDDVDRAVEVPIHPYVMVFDLQKHRRLSMHIKDLVEYKYDLSIQDRLVLPADLKSLVSILIEHKSGGFKDVIAGKGDGAVVMLAGPPGTGKTLTAEVYAESEERALYSVQCSQLGTNAEDLEKELKRCFLRASRWNAVMLLDEADVYVHERGDDMEQNAIVGVFLRVLEYQSSVLFLTTNRASDVDDAVLSRCVARVPYKVPTPSEQAKIWRVLADTAGIKLAEPVLKKIVEENPGISGRDVKNLLKLANLISRGAPITVKGIKFARQFQPTNIAEEVDDA